MWVLCEYTTFYWYHLSDYLLIKIYKCEFTLNNNKKAFESGLNAYYRRRQISDIISHWTIGNFNFLNIQVIIEGLYMFYFIFFLITLTFLAINLF